MVDNTFHLDFTIADRFGIDAIKDTFNRAFKEWKTDYKMLTALAITLNHKCWEWYSRVNTAEDKQEVGFATKLVELYESLWRTADAYALDNLKDDQLKYYLEETD